MLVQFLVPRKLSSFYALKLARFHAKVRHDKKLAEKVLRDAINNDKVHRNRIGIVVTAMI